MSICMQCPRRCGVDRARGEYGVCGSSDRVRIARAALHLWEEPVVSGKRGSGTIFFSGCNLHCVYCQNKEVSHNGKGRDVTERQLAEHDNEADENRKQQVDQQERKAAALAHLEREAPDVAEADRGTDSGEQQAEVRTE